MINLANINTFIDDLRKYDVMPLLRAAIYLSFGFMLARISSQLLMRLCEKRNYPEYGLLARKLSFYAIFTLFMVSALRELGFDLRVLLGATGLLTIAIGFASQTSASNFISGLFLLGERAFQIGDTIIVNGITGDVFSMNLFSVKLKQGDNTFVRVPNELILKTQVVNLTRFPERRYDSTFTVTSNTDIDALKETLFAKLKLDPLCLTVPAPSLEIKELGSIGIVLILHVSAKQKNFAAMKQNVQENLLETLREQQIDFTTNTHRVRLLKESANDNHQNDFS